jgi:hypothetical protein
MLVIYSFGALFVTSVAEPHQFDAATGKIFDAAPAPFLLYTKLVFLNKQKSSYGLGQFFLLISSYLNWYIKKLNGKSKKLL